MICISVCVCVWCICPACFRWHPPMQAYKVFLSQTTKPMRNDNRKPHCPQKPIRIRRLNVRPINAMSPLAVYTKDAIFFLHFNLWVRVGYINDILCRAVFVPIKRVKCAASNCAVKAARRTAWEFHKRNQVKCNVCLCVYYMRQCELNSINYLGYLLWSRIRGGNLFVRG